MNQKRPDRVKEETYYKDADFTCTKKEAEKIQQELYRKETDLEHRKVDIIHELGYTTEPLKTKALLERCIHNGIIARDPKIIEHYLTKYIEFINTLKQDFENKKSQNPG